MAYAEEVIAPEEWRQFKTESFLLNSFDGPINCRAIDRESGNWIVEVANSDWREEWSRFCVFVSADTSVSFKVNSDLAGHLEVSIRERVGLSANDFREISSEVFRAVAALYKCEKERVVFAEPAASNIGCRIKP